MRQHIQVAAYIAAIVLAASCSGQKENAIQPISLAGEGVCKSVKAEKKADIEIKDGIFFLENVTASGGMILNGDWDLSDYKSLEFTILNKSDRASLLQVQIMEKAGITFREPEKGLQVYKMSTYPGQEQKVCIDLMPALPHPEVAENFRLMRNDPYSRLSGNYCYEVDMSNIHRIVFIFTRGGYDGSYEIRDLRFVPGPKKALDPAMQLDSASFFPFIDKYGQFKHAEWPGKVHSDKDLAAAAKKEARDLKKHPGASDWSKFGGWAAGPKYEATGHFRVEKIDGKWWMIDPEGYLFWSNGVVRVTPSSAVTPLEGKNLENRCFYYEDLPAEGSDFFKFYSTHDALLHPYYTARDIDSTYDFSSANAYRKYGPDYWNVWADLAHRRLRSWGLNTIANSSDKDICKMDRTAYMDRFEVVSKPLAGTKGWWPFMDPFDESFNESLKMQFETRKEEVQDPWCLGFFVDNEIQWKGVTYLAEMTVKAPADQPCKQVMVSWLKEKYGTIKALNNVWKTGFASWKALEENSSEIIADANTKDDLRAFNRQIIEKYYQNIRAAFDAYAPGVLYMGCRFAGGKPTNVDVGEIGAKYCDVVSVNRYSYDYKDYVYQEGIDLPVMIGEFHCGAMDRGMFHASLIDVKSQDARGEAYYNYVKSALEHPNIIGVHWHQFSDQATTGRFDGEDFQVGFTDVCDTPYYETIEGIRRIGYNMYKIRSEAK